MIHFSSFSWPHEIDREELPLKGGIFRTNLTYLVNYAPLAFGNYVDLYIVIQTCKYSMSAFFGNISMCRSLQDMVSSPHFNHYTEMYYWEKSGFLGNLHVIICC